MSSAHNRLLASIIAIAALAITMPWGAIAKDKIPTRNVDELPRHTYDVTMKVSEILQSEEAMADLMKKIEKSLDETLATYEIRDRATLQGYYSSYYNINVLRGNYDTALEYIAKARELEDKPAQKLMIGVMAESYVKALGVSKDTNSQAFKKAYHKFTVESLEPMPWDVVEDLVQQMRGQMQMFSTQMLLGVVQGQMDPPVAKAGFLSGDQAAQVLNLKVAMDIAMPMKDVIVQALGDKIAMHQEEEKDNIWPAREVTLTGREGYSTVVVGVWDAGTDTDVFKDQLFTNTDEKLDGEDNDGNGFVDDVHGIAYDLNHDKTTEALYPLGPYADKRRQLEDHLKGFFDVNAAINSPEADAVKARASKLQPAEVKEFFESLSLYAYHSHGTHVAGIALNGNPYARLLAARLSFDHHVTPMPFTTELIKKFGTEFREATQYFADNKVRVVNMSWGLTLKEIEGTLEANGIGASAEERGKMARDMFAIAKKDLEAAFRAAPNVLFVGAAGNSDTDVEFDGFIPSAFELPNLIIAGAVDRAGEATGFTSHGRTVEVYANGFEVDSYVPGGRRLALSGTSMAAPNVTNLAAKLLARDPSLKPEDVIRLIKEGAEDFGKDKPMMVINPKRSMELLENKLTSKSG